MTFLPSQYNDLPDNIKELVLVKTNIGTYFFDAFFRVDHTSNLKVTDHPVESGSTISDHAYVEPVEIIMEIGMSDVAGSLVPGQFDDSWSRSVSAFKLLQQLQIDRELLFVHTRLRTYNNMIITSISAPDEAKTLFGLRVSVTLREVLITGTQVVPVSSAPQVTDSTNNGQVNPVTETNESIFYQLFGPRTGQTQEYLWPSPGNYSVSSKFGVRVHPITEVESLHRGIDIRASVGQKVIASKAGTVDIAGDVSGYGRTVRIQHGNGFTLYAHNSELTVNVGQSVDQGQQIALSGATGNVTGPHIHFEVNENGTYVDPQKVID